jgi:hypothetical protein
MHCAVPLRCAFDSLSHLSMTNSQLDSQNHTGVVCFLMEYDEQVKAASPIPLLLDTIDKRQASLVETARALAERLDKALRPDDTESANQAAPRERLGGSNLATRLTSVSLNLGDLEADLNQLMARLEL